MRVGDRVRLKDGADLNRSGLNHHEQCLFQMEGFIDSIRDIDECIHGNIRVLFENGDAWWIFEDMLTVLDAEEEKTIVDIMEPVGYNLSSTEGYLAFHRDFTEEMRAITKTKNHDYAGHGDGNPFANFELVEKMGFISTEEGFITRMTDKVSRLMTFIKKGVLMVKGEGIRDALMDLANYCILLAAYIERKRQKGDEPKQECYTDLEPDPRKEYFISERDEKIYDRHDQQRDSDDGRPMASEH